jgi:entericidin A
MFLVAKLNRAKAVCTKPFHSGCHKIKHEKVMRNLLLVLILMSAVSLGGCETMEGLGKDIKTLGEKIEKKASSSE